MKTRLSALALALLLGGGMASAQKILVTGRVTNASNAVLPKVQVVVEDELKGLARLELDDVESLLGSCHAATSLLYDDLDFREHCIRSVSDAPCDQDFLR